MDPRLWFTRRKPLASLQQDPCGLYSHLLLGGYWSSTYKLTKRNKMKSLSIIPAIVIILSALTTSAQMSTQKMDIVFQLNTLRLYFKRSRKSPRFPNQNGITGHLHATEDRYGFQATFFRYALNPMLKPDQINLVISISM